MANVVNVMTKSFEYDRITDELLSAYIDDAVTDKERAMVDAAVQADAEVAWRLDTLQQTVLLIRSLPEIALPRSFTLTKADLVGASTGSSVDAKPEQAGILGRITGSLGSFWGQGSGLYRNLAAASLALLLVAVGANGVFSITDVGMTAQSLDSIAPEFEMAQFAEELATAPALELDAGMAKSDATVGGEAAGSDGATEEVVAEEIVEEAELATTVETSTNETVDDMQAMAAAAAVPEAAVAEESQIASDEAASDQATSDETESDEAAPAESANAETLMSEAAPVAALEMSPPAPSADAESAITPAMATGMGMARSAVPASEASAESAPSDEIAMAGQSEASEQSDMFGAMAVPMEESQDTAEAEIDSDIVAMPAGAEMAGSEASYTTTMADEGDDVAEDEGEVAVAEAEVAEQEAESMPDSLAAVPAPLNAIPPTSAQVSPLDYPYPPPPEPTSFFQSRDFVALNILIVGLLALTIVFGGLWWRSRDNSSGDDR